MKKLNFIFFWTVCLIFFANYVSAQKQVYHHWEHGKELAIKAGKDTTIVIDFLLIGSNGVKNYEIQLPHDYGFVLPLDTGTTIGTYHLEKQLKLILMPGESLTIKPWASGVENHGWLYATGYYVLN